MIENINNIKLYWEEYGAGIPILSIHGYFVDSTLMKSCLEPNFTKNSKYKRIYIDLVGMGNTSASDTIENADNLLELLAEFIRRVIGEQPFILLGESYGGYLSLGLLRYFPKQVMGLFAICPCVIGNNNKRNLPKKQTLIKEDIALESAEVEDFDSFLEMAVVATEYTWKRYKEEILVGVQKANGEYLHKFQEQGYSFSFESELTSFIFDKPSVFLLGKQDHVVGYKDALQLQDNFTRGTFAVIDGAGHNLQIEKPALFNSFVQDFLMNFCD